MFVAVSSLIDRPDLPSLDKVKSLEDELDGLRTELVKGHLERLENGQCKPQNSNIFINLVGNLERCGDHLNFIAERNCSQLIGKQEDTLHI